MPARHEPGGCRYRSGGHEQRIYNGQIIVGTRSVFWCLLRNCYLPVDICDDCSRWTPKLPKEEGE